MRSRMAARLDKGFVKTALKIVLPIWLIIKLIALILTLFTEIDLTFLNSGVELGFQSLVYSKDAAAGLAIFICFVVVLSIGYPMSFLVLPDSRVQNIIGFFAFMLITLVDIVSAFVLGLGDGMMIISAILSLNRILVVGLR